MNDQWIKETLRGGTQANIIWVNGDRFCVLSESYAVMTYITGDSIKFTYRDGQYRMSRITTHDGLTFDIGE
jgi:hypothetical protein